jgi:CRP/FNR family transcriptional regulator
VSSHQDALWRLRNLRLFQRLTPREFRELSRLLTARDYRRSEFIFHAGEKVDLLFFLAKGNVKILVSSPEGEERVLDICRPGDILGELFLGKDAHRMAAAQALTDVTAWTMTRQGVINLMQTFPHLCFNFLCHLVGQLRDVLLRTHALWQLKAGHRLLAVLLDVAEGSAQGVGDFYTLPETMTQGDLASMVGLNRSTVNLLVNDYRRKGILGGRGRTLLIYRTPARAVLKKAGYVPI